MRKRNYVEDLAVNYDAGLLKIAQTRRWLLLAFLGGLVATALIWIAVLLFPQAASFLFSNFLNSNLPSRYSNLVNILLMSIPFVPPFVSAFALGNLLSPSQASEIPSGVMASFDYQQKSSKQWLLIVAAGMCGGLNCLLLLIAVSSATGH